MSTKEKLAGSFGSLSDTLAFRFDPSLPPEVAGRWLAVMAHASAVTHMSAQWIALPAQSMRYDGLIVQLDDSTHAIVTATNAAAKLAALAQADVALDSVAAVLDAGTGNNVA